MGFKDLFKPSGDTIKGVLQGAGDMAKDIRDAVTGEGNTLKAGELENKALELANKVDLALIEVSKVEAQGNVFQRSWRPGLAWVIILVIFVQYLLHPVLGWIWIWSGQETIPAPATNAADLWPIILMLIGYRSYEKKVKI